MATVKVSEETYKKLNELAGKLRSKLGRPVSVDEALDFTMKGSRKSKPGDFTGAWSSMTDREEAELLGDLDKLWRRWKLQKE